MFASSASDETCGSGLGRFFIFLDFDRSADSNGGAETLVVCVANLHAHVNRAAAEVQYIISPRIRWKPIVALDVFAKCLETGKNVLVIFLDDIRHRFAVALYDVQIFFILPDAA